MAYEENCLHFLGNKEKEKVGYIWLRTSGKDHRGDYSRDYLEIITGCACVVLGENKKHGRNNVDKVTAEKSTRHVRDYVRISFNWSTEFVTSTKGGWLGSVPKRY